MSSSRPTAARLHHAWALPLGAVVVLALAGCGGGAANAKAPGAAPAASASAGAGARAAGPNQQDRGGVRGTIAAVTGQLMQVQDTSSQTAVAWTSSTTITQEVAGTLADVKPGVCLLAVTGGPGASGTATASPSGAATSVTVTQPVNGTCTAGFGGVAGGAPGGGMPNGRPSGAPGYGTRPSGAPTRGAGGFVRPTDGLVTAVAGDTITVQPVTGTGAGATTGTATVTVDSATTYRTTKAADATAIVVGQCATARGPADSSGKVTATSIMVSAPTNGSCVTAYRGGFGNRNGQSGQTQQGAVAGTNA